MSLKSIKGNIEVVVVDKPRYISCRDRSDWSNLSISSSMEGEEGIEIVAYFFLWLCRFVLPYRDKCIKVETLKASSKMADKYLLASLVPPILASIYKGLTRMLKHPSSQDLDSIHINFLDTFFMLGLQHNLSMVFMLMWTRIILVL